MKAWIRVVGFAALGVVAVSAGLIRTLRTRPAFFPYTMLLFAKGFSIIGPIFKNVIVKFSGAGHDAKDVPNTIFEVAGRLDLASAKRHRDALVELGEVPTIAKGLDELGYK